MNSVVVGQKVFTSSLDCIWTC